MADSAPDAAQPAAGKEPPAQAEANAASSVNPIPAILRLTTSHYLLDVNNVVTFTLSVSPYVEANLDGVELELTLPGRLNVLSADSGIVRGNRVLWTLPSVLSSPIFTQQIVGQVGNGAPEDGLKVTSSLNKRGWQSQNASLLLAVGLPPQEVIVLLDPASKAQGIVVRVEPLTLTLDLQDDQAESMPVNTVPSEPASEGNKALPVQVEKESEEEPQLEQGEGQVEDNPLADPIEVAPATSTPSERPLRETPEPSVESSSLSAQADAPQSGEMVTTTQIFLPIVSENGNEGQVNETDLPAIMPSIEASTSLGELSVEQASVENAGPQNPAGAAQDEQAVRSDLAAPVTSVAHTANSNGRNPVAAWNIEAFQNNAPVHRLAESATLIFSTESLRQRGINPEALSLYTREQSGDPWVSVQTEYRPQEGIVVVQTNHFSAWMWDATKVMSSGHLLPSLRGFSSDHNTGFAVAGLPIEAPAGLGGLTPGLSLAYSSGTVDDIAYLADAAYRNVQGSWAGGLGWNLGGLSYIYINFQNDNQPTLVLNGTAVKLAASLGGTWRSDPELFYEIRNENGFWQVRTPDGREYQFATIMTLRSQAFHDSEDPNDRYFYDIDVHSRFYLTKVTDSLGNTMEYTYEKETDCAPRGYAECGHSTTPYTEGSYPVRFCGPYESNPITGNYDRAIYLKEVRWSGSTQGTSDTSDDDPPSFRMVFTTSPRPDGDVHGVTNPCDQAQYGSKRLTEIKVMTCLQLMNNETRNVCSNITDTTRWHTLRKYELLYRDNNMHSLLEYLKEYGEGGTDLLRTHTFKYQSDAEFCTTACATVNKHADFLRKVDNGWGGRATYYLSNKPLNCIGSNDCNGRIPARVDRMVFDDGIGNFAVTDYSYIGDPANPTMPDRPLGNFKDTADHEYEYLGYGETIATTRALSSDANVFKHPNTAGVVTPSAEKKERWVFYMRTGTGPNDIDARHGKTRFYGTYRPSVTTPANDNALATQQFAIWTSGGWTNDTGWEVVTLSNPARNWVRQSWVYATTNGIYPDGAQKAGFGNTKRFYYEDAATGYGRLLRVQEYDGQQVSGGTPLRTTVTNYVSNVHIGNSATYLTATPSRLRIYAGEFDANNPLNNCKAETRTVYWDPTNQNNLSYNRAGNYTTTPWSSLPIRSEQALESCTDAPSITEQAFIRPTWSPSGIVRSAKVTLYASFTIDFIPI